MSSENVEFTFDVEEEDCDLLCRSTVDLPEIHEHVLGSSKEIREMAKRLLLEGIKMGLHQQDLCEYLKCNLESDCGGIWCAVIGTAFVFRGQCSRDHYLHFQYENNHVILSQTETLELRDKSVEFPTKRQEHERREAPSFIN
ncbi:hypothetical protein ACOME3_003791 [Neoechinorhynchus agilis]